MDADADAMDTMDTMDAADLLHLPVVGQDLTHGHHWRGGGSQQSSGWLKILLASLLLTMSMVVMVLVVLMVVTVPLIALVLLLRVLAVVLQRLQDGLWNGVGSGQVLALRLESVLIGCVGQLDELALGGVVLG